MKKSIVVMPHITPFYCAGTFEYAAPELLLGEACTEHIDIYR